MEGFGDWESPPVGLDSTWKKKKDTVALTMQTEPLQIEEKGIQSHTSATIQTQTNEDPKEDFATTPYPPSLYAFLAKVIEPMCEALQENLNPFSVGLSNDLDENSDVDELNPDNEAEKIHELRSSAVSSDFEGSSVSWNSTGNQVAVGYRTSQHDSWCTHSTPVSIWNLARVKSEMDQPHYEVSFDTCSTSLAFHPKIGNLLAIGLYSGDVALVDLNPSTPQSDLTQTERNIIHQEPLKLIDGSCHSTPVVGIKWVILSQSQITKLAKINPNPSTSFILTAATDGFIGLWSINKTYTKISLERKFLAHSEHLPDNVNIPKRSLSQVKEIGISALSSCTDDPTTFIFATFGSMVFQGDLLTPVEIHDMELQNRNPTSSYTPLMNGVTNFITEQQRGYINTLECSPYHRNLFLSVTDTGHILLQNTLQSTPTLQFYTDNESTTDVKWSVRPMMFGVAEGNKLSIFDLLVNKVKPVLSASHKSPLRAIEFEKTGTDLMATTDSEGVLHIWKLPKGVTGHQFNELDALVELGQIKAAPEPEGETHHT